MSSLGNKQTIRGQSKTSTGDALLRFGMLTSSLPFVSPSGATCGYSTERPPRPPGCAPCKNHLTRSLPLILPCGRPLAASRAAAPAARVSFPLYNALSRWFSACERRSPVLAKPDDFREVASCGLSGISGTPPVVRNVSGTDGEVPVISTTHATLRNRYTAFPRSRMMDGQCCRRAANARMWPRYEKTNRQTIVSIGFQLG